MEARRLALVRAGLLEPDGSALPSRAGRNPRRACYAVIRRFGYLQLDTIPIAGARSHALVLLSRLPDLDPELPESLLRPRAPLFEYWGHEASWLPIELYPVFEFRRREYRRRTPWWGRVVQDNRSKAAAILRRIRRDGPLRSADFEDRTERSDWGFTITRRLLRCLWWAGDLAVRERRNFQPYYDLTENVIPAAVLGRTTPERDATKILLLKSLDGHGWASAKTLVDTWRLTNRSKLVKECLEELAEDGVILPCRLEDRIGWIRVSDRELAARLRGVRPRTTSGVLLSPFDPLLWDRERVRRLFGFEQLLEVFKPAHRRKYGYYCMPVLAGERLVGRCDLKADRKSGRLEVLSIHHENDRPHPAVKRALTRYARALKLRLDLGASAGVS